MNNRSIKHQLIVLVIAGSALVLLISALFLDHMLSLQMQKLFDNALLDRARALASLVEKEPKGINFEFSNEIMPDFDNPQDPQYFQIWLSPNSVLERSHYLNGRDLPRFQSTLHQHSIHDIQLPDGRPGRLVEIVFIPRIDNEKEEEEIATHLNAYNDPTKTYVTLSLARERITLQQQRSITRTIIIGAMLIILLSIATLVKKFVSAGLLPLERLAAQMKEIDEYSLDKRITLTGPQTIELAPIESQVNNLLERIESTLRREKRFSADVSHELRTPLAELRTLAEVGKQEPTDRETVLSFFRDVEDISLQMENLIVTLIELARADAGQLQLHSTIFLLSPLIDAIQAGLESNSVFTKHIRNDVPANLLVHTDREKLMLILENLLSNAYEYSPANATIRVFSVINRDSIDLIVENLTTDLEPSDILLMQERFWRKDQARSLGGHSGLGLPLVKMLAEALELVLDISLDEKNVLRIALKGLQVH